MEIHLNTVLLLQEMPAISLCSVLHCSITRCHIMIVLIQNIKTIINFKSEIDICIEIDSRGIFLKYVKFGIFPDLLSSTAVENFLDLTTRLPIWFKMKFRSWNVIKSLCSNKKFEKPRLLGHELSYFPNTVLSLAGWFSREESLFSRRSNRHELANFLNGLSLNRYSDLSNNHFNNTILPTPPCWLHPTPSLTTC